MDGEEEGGVVIGGGGGSKKRAKETEVGMEADDDEVIGAAMLKMKSKRGFKRVKVGLDGEKGVEDEALVGMEDTLASFTKRLKGPKRGSGVGSAARKDLGDGDLSVESVSGSTLVDSVDVIREDAIKGVDSSSGLEGSKLLEKNRRVKIKRSKSKSGSDVSMDSDNSIGCGEAVVGSKCEETAEDTLLTLFRKVKTDLLKKSRKNSNLKPKKEEVSDLDGDLCPSMPAGSVDSESVAAQEPRLNKSKDSNLDECLSQNVHVGSNQVQLKSNGNQGSTVRLAQLTNGAELSPSFDSDCAIADKSAREADGSPDQASKVVTDHELPVMESVHGLVSCSKKVKELQASSTCRTKNSLVESSDRINSYALERSDRSIVCNEQSTSQEAKLQDGLKNSGFSNEGNKFSEFRRPILVVECTQGLYKLDEDDSNTKLTNTSVQLSTKLLQCGILGSHREQKESNCRDANANSESVEIRLNAALTQSNACNSHGKELHDVITSNAIKVAADDHLPANGEANGASSDSVTPDHGDVCQEDSRSFSEHEKNCNDLTAVRRASRKSKKHRHGDMAYDGDFDWEDVLHEQSILASHQYDDYYPPSQSGDKFHAFFNTDSDVQLGGVAAVSAGLKAHKVSTMEKIIFKEVLKRKGGLQEYLSCRNRILCLWSKDVSRILPITDCGVSLIATNDDSPRSVLIRDIYLFLDQRGYINTGIAAKKERAEATAKHNYKLLGGQSFEGNPGDSVADMADGVSFILGRLSSSEVAKEDVNRTNKALKSDTSTAVDASAEKVHERFSYEAAVNHCTTSTSGERGGFGMDSSGNKLGNDAVPESTKDLIIVKTASNCPMEESDGSKLASKKKKTIIVVGAGPAGLTAARHLQRLGFSVIVLEARSRVGGRVHTDRSSFSVPVDLGASIITGVEADVATERRPDPSALVCAQLGLKLTVLNSDCPLYDVMTGEKVPRDLDESLEAEFNTLLDDTLLLVAQKGENASEVSLEEGLEYALERRRMARLTTEREESQLPDTSVILEEGTSDGDGDHYEHETLSPLERRVMDWHFANLEYGCAALLKEVSLPHWNQDDIYGGFGGAHCMIKGGYGAVVESLASGLPVHLNQVVTNISYDKDTAKVNDEHYAVKVSTSNGDEYTGDAVLITVPLGCLKAESIKFTPPLPAWKHESIHRLGYGVLNKVVLEFPEVFWDDTVDYFGATAEDTVQRGHCFMFWNVKKTVGAPILIALVVGKAAIDGQCASSSDHVSHAVAVLRKIFGEAGVPCPVASAVTDWGRDPFSYGAYSFVAIGSSGEDYDILGRPVDGRLFFAGEATCKEHPDTVGGAMMSGIREAVRIIDILNTGKDYTAEVEVVEAALIHSDGEKNEVRDIARRLEAVELSAALYNKSSGGHLIVSKESLLQELFSNAKTSAGRLRLAKELLNLPVESLKSFAGTKKGLTTLNSWILDSLGKDGTQLLRHCVRILVLVSTDLLAVRLSGIGRTVKEKVCVHTSRDIRSIASQLVNVWIEVFRKEKASNGGFKSLKHMASTNSSKSKGKDAASKNPSVRSWHGAIDNRLPVSIKKATAKQSKKESISSLKSDVHSSSSHGSKSGKDHKTEEASNVVLSMEEQAALAAAEAARAAAAAASEAYAAAGTRYNTSLQLPKIPSFHKFARREQYGQVEDSEFSKRWPGGVSGRQDCISEIDSRNFRVRDWSVDFSATCANLDSSRMSNDNLSQRSQSNDMAYPLNLTEHSGDSAAVDSGVFTKAWVDSAGSIGIKDYHAIERWQSQAAAAESEFQSMMHIRDEEDSNKVSSVPSRKHDIPVNESSVSLATVNKANEPRGADCIKQAVVDYVASLLMPLYKARKIDREGYKLIMKKTATKVMEQMTDVEKLMTTSEFLDFKRKNKIRAFVDKLIERHMSMVPTPKA